ncbi:Uma2 family endonuclease [Embleya sp. NPDC001921]
MVTAHAGMPVEEFEGIARDTAESVRLEFIGGRVGVKAMPDGDHDEFVVWLIEEFARQQRTLSVYPARGLKIEKYRKGRARPDCAVAPKRSFVGQGEWADPAAVLMVVEVTSLDPDTDRRDRADKPRAYAETDIPIYLLVDRDSCETVLHSDPANGTYTTIVKRPFGKPVHLPAPVDLMLETEDLLDLVR